MGTVTATHCQSSAPLSQLAAACLKRDESVKLSVVVTIYIAMAVFSTRHMAQGFSVVKHKKVAVIV